ncbi:MAG TPA: type II toxin-antitoxin system RelE/ParE family toxin [Pirellulales bacterium]|nr:type II toxin-antitoxin system RelE/ParE family toxin [Pirellulales bacterium]
MSKPFVVVAATEHDLAAAADGYDAQARGLGDDFLHEVDEALDRIRSFPEMYQVVFPGVRRAILHRFPFAVVYRIRTTSIDIIGVLPCRADPQILAERATLLGRR